jgi:hypothetical protein
MPWPELPVLKFAYFWVLKDKGCIYLRIEVQLKDSIFRRKTRLLIDCG